jgi:hypothetical protein
MLPTIAMRDLMAPHNFGSPSTPADESPRAQEKLDKNNCQSVERSQVDLAAKRMVILRRWKHAVAWLISLGVAAHAQRQHNGNDKQQSSWAHFFAQGSRPSSIVSEAIG